MKYAMGDKVKVNHLSNDFLLQPGSVVTIAGLSPTSDRYFVMITTPFGVRHEWAGEYMLDPHTESKAELQGHEGHEIIDNIALGKRFKVCRQCKVEV